MAEQFRSSLLGIKKEVTEGTPVLPTSGADFSALQNDFKFEPKFNDLENAELKPSIGKSKSITGLEQPSASLSHYLRGSGIEGTAPDYSDLLESGFGAISIAGTEHVTVSGSTAKILKVGSGIGADFQRGQFVLVKDPINGYSLRPILSISGDFLTLLFPLVSAPGVGVSLGKCVLFKPASTGHPALTLTNYLGNGGGIQLMAGSKTKDFSIDIKAGDFINVGYSFEGTKYYFNPINITSTDIKLDFLDDATTRVATIAAKLYTDPDELASAVQTAMNSLGSSNVFTFTYSDTLGKFIATSNGTTLTLLFGTGSNLANSIADKIGFAASDHSAALTYTSDTAQSWASPYSPSYDDADPLVAKDNELLIGDGTETTCYCASSCSIKFTNTITNVLCICSPSGVQSKLINAREVTIEAESLMERHDVDKWVRVRANTSTAFMYNFGEKSGGNWLPGKCGGIAIPTMSFQEFTPEDQDGLIGVKISGKAFVDSQGNGEVYLGLN